MAAGRLWVAGLGMFLLARAWGLGPWGRWFAGLVFPFSGFLVVWLLYPVTAVAIWMPWLFLATDRLFHQASGRRAGLLAIVVALIVMGGHIQTSAHVLIAGGLYAALAGVVATRSAMGAPPARLLDVGCLLGAVACERSDSPAGRILGEKPRLERTPARKAPWWTVARPRLLELACTAVPYVYGSQRRGQPNLAKALGVNNLNESAGGFAGLGTLLWLAPLALLSRGRSFHVAFLAALAYSAVPWERSAFLRSIICCALFRCLK